MLTTPSQSTLTTRFNDVEILIAKTMEYLSVPSVVGHESLFMDHLEHDFKDLGKATQRFEGVLEIHGANPLSAIVCAHIDRHGLISLGNGEYEYAAEYVRQVKYGEPNEHSKAELRSIEGRFEGEQVFAYDSDNGTMLGFGTIEKFATCEERGEPVFNVKNMGEVAEGTPIAYARTAKIKGEYLRGQIDNTISISTVYALFANGFEGTALLTCEEEIGKSWVHIANYLEAKKIKTQNLVVIDTSPFSDADPVREGHLILRGRDFREEFNPDMLEDFKRRCKRLGIPFMQKDKYLLSLGRTVEQLGSTELGRLIKHKGGEWSGSTVQIPTLAYHTSRETTSKAAITNYYKFLYDLLVKNTEGLDYKSNS